MMISIGKYHQMKVVKEVEFGLYLSPIESEEEILLPIKYVLASTKVDDIIEVFIYNDSENRPIATTLKPLATVGQFAYLMVIDETEHGVFMDLGIAKDVFVPIREQSFKMRVGKEYVVYLYIDEKSGRIVASSKWNKFIRRDLNGLNEKDEVSLLIAEQTDLGYNAIINHTYIGLIYNNEVFEPIGIGDQKKGFIKKIREENKIDLSLQPAGYGQVLDAREKILELLRKNKGILKLGDKSDPEEIYRIANLSKKVFKKTIGNLLRDRLVQISDYEVVLISAD